MMNLSLFDGRASTKYRKRYTGSTYLLLGSQHGTPCTKTTHSFIPFHSMSSTILLARLGWAGLGVLIYLPRALLACENPRQDSTTCPARDEHCARIQKYCRKFRIRQLPFLFFTISFHFKFRPEWVQGYAYFMSSSMDGCMDDSFFFLSTISIHSRRPPLSSASELEGESR